MPLTVVSFATYLSAPPGTQWRYRDWDAYKFVQGVKGKPINKFARVPVLGTIRHLDQSNADNTLHWFAELAANYILTKQLSAPLVFIPVPNSSSAVTNSNTPRTFLQSQALTARLQPVSVLDCLRWREEMASASSGGGTRKPQELYENLVITQPIPTESSIILIDDVRTTGGHLQAARAALQERGGKCGLAICAARTVWDQTQDPFSPMEEEISDWSPDY